VAGEIQKNGTRLLSTVQAAEYLGVSTNSIRNYIARGWLTAHRIGPKLLKFDPAEPRPRDAAGLLTDTPKTVRALSVCGCSLPC
jgi:excisionase family DNA binding protein